MVDIDDKSYSDNKKRGWEPNRRRSNSRENSKETECVPRIPLYSLCHIAGLRVVWVRWDRTQHGWHVIIKVRQKLTLAETIAAQAILGSDRKREMLNLARCISVRKRPSRYWEQRANILYERKLK